MEGGMMRQVKLRFHVNSEDISHVDVEFSLMDFLEWAVGPHTAKVLANAVQAITVEGIFEEE
jgi:hypothetical protein